MTQSLETLREIRALLIDMDGVLWRGKAPMPGLGDFFGLLRGRPIAFRLVTNNAGRTPDQYVEKLAGMGVHVTRDEILTSGVATAQYLVATTPGASVYVIGTEGFRQLLAGYGLHLSSGDRADFVVVGWDQELTFRKLADASILIRAGAKFIGTNPDVTWPDDQVLLPGNGATLAYLQASTGVAPLIIGKPERPMFDAALAALGADRTETAMLGDRIETDILGAQDAGLRAILVLSGASSRADLEASPVRPDWVFDDIQALTRAWKEIGD
jgi:4-nitrophenyl phosphatase